MLIQALLFLGPVLWSAPAQDPADPDVGPEGHQTYMGREIARTMHWTGASWLLRVTREQQENGARLREWLAVQPGQTVCDLGSGNGYHSLPLARTVLPGGRVLAVDLQPPMLAMLLERAADVGLDNIEPIEAEVDNPHLPPESCDLVLMVDVYHELSHPVRVMKHVKRALRRGGRVVLVEFRSEDPKVPILPLHKMTKAQVVNEMAAQGFRLAGQFDGLPWQHAMSFELAPEDLEGEAFDLHCAREVALTWWAAVKQQDLSSLGGFHPAEAGDSLPDWELQGRPLEDLLAGWTTSVGLGSKEGVLTAAFNAEGPFGSRVSARLEREDTGCWRVVHVDPLVLVTRSAAAEPEVLPELHAMNTATGGGPPAVQLARAAEAGYAGIGWGMWRIPELQEALVEHDLELLSVYAVLDIEQEVDRREEQLAVAIGALPQGGQVWLVLESPSRPHRDPSGDELALTKLKRVAELAADRGAKVALCGLFHFLKNKSADLAGCIFLILSPNPSIPIISFYH